ncbi:MAG: MBL fold metallo-hydrolase [Roseiflexaceae bacterium]
MQQIIQNVYALQSPPIGRVYLLDDADGSTLIDASVDAAAPRILRELAQAQRPPSSIKRILITHAHPDHIGALAALQQASGAIVYASAADRPVITREIPLPKPPDSALSPLGRMIRANETWLGPAPVDRIVSDGEILPEVFGGIQVIATPGHTEGHVSYWLPNQRLLFTGDVVLHMFGLGLPVSFFTYNMNESIRSLQKIAQLQPEVLCFGHGLPLMQQTAQRLAAFAQKVSR